MADKNVGLVQKYEVKKLNNPEKELSCIVLEFDDPIGREGIKAWAKEMDRNGYHQCARDVRERLRITPVR